ncbi:hypothetical protein TWF679_009090 [Orbilia oligospora]|uniref:Uncharacterized protein n=1 Tax=Orbilia oligospora TaxID=2813651 RepID=A0A8H8V3K2_ORBOL|nr:hypothetical protein TWF679_009090 [Orbilia oligospora]
MGALIPPAPNVFKFLALFLCLFNGAYPTPLGNGTRSVNSASLTISNDDIDATVSNPPSMNSPKPPPSPTSEPTAAETPNSSRIVKKAEFISPSLFYQQGQMSVECPSQKGVMAIIRDYVGGTRRYPLPDLVGTGITAEEWNRQLDVWGKVIEDDPVAGKAKRYVQNLQKRCFACRCNSETARLVHETSPLRRNPCSNRMIALKCEVYFQYEGQALRFTTPPWDPPSLPLENLEPLEPYFDIDRSLWADHDPNDPNPPPIRLYGPQANPINLDFDLDDFLDFTGMGDQDMFDVPPGLEYEYGYGHGPHGYGYGFGEGSGGSGSGSGGSGRAKRDLGRRNKAYRVNEGDLETEKARMKRN